MSAAYILVVDDEPEIRRLVREILEDEHYRVATAESAESARELYRKQRPDLVLLDIWMPGTDGISLLREWVQPNGTSCPVVMMSGHGTVETAVEATRLGAYDFIEKPVAMAKLLVTVERALAAERMRRENIRLKRAAEPDTFLVGKSQVMQQLREDLERVAATDTWVLMLGEPGSGRVLAARYLHYHSARRDKPLIEVSLGAVAPMNVAIKLFGAEQGDGGVNPGSFEQAADGTLLLNDIGELAPATQLQLLHALQDRQYMRVGGREPLPMTARVIAISDTALPDAVAEGRFREDLYYRLNVVPLRIPPLRDHREDVPELVKVYLDWLIDNERLTYRRFTTGALNALRNYPWPGNVRELMNVVQRLLILNRGEEITETEVEQALGGARATGEALPHALFGLPLRAARDQFEKAYLEHHLARTGGNVAEVARLSEMERTHLYRKLKNLGINPKAVKE